MTQAVLCHSASKAFFNFILYASWKKSLFPSAEIIWKVYLDNKLERIRLKDTVDRSFYGWLRFHVLRRIFRNDYECHQRTANCKGFYSLNLYLLYGYLTEKTSWGKNSHDLNLWFPYCFATFQFFIGVVEITGINWELN